MRISRFHDGSGRLQRFRSLKTLQKSSSVHAQVHNLFNQERHLVPGQVYKQRRSIWRSAAPLPRRASLASGCVALRSANAITSTTPRNQLRWHAVQGVPDGLIRHERHLQFLATAKVMRLAPHGQYHLLSGL